MNGTRRGAVRLSSRTAPAATVGGIRTRVLETEGSGPTVLLAHGYSDSADCWRALMDSLAAVGVRSVAVDLPYHGRAGRPPITSFFTVVDNFLAAAVQQFDNGNGVMLVGNSVGGLSALRIAQRTNLPADSALRAVVAISPAGLSTPLWMKVLRRGRPVVTGILAATDVRIMRGTNVAPALITSGFARAVAGGKLSPTARAQYASHWGPGDLRRQLLLGGQTIDELVAPDVLDTKPFQVPVTVVFGGRDWITPARGANAFARAHPDAITRVLPGAGHCPQYDCPERLNALIVAIHHATAWHRSPGEEKT